MAVKWERIVKETWKGRNACDVKRMLKCADGQKQPIC